MSSSPERRLGKRDGLRYAITWLHRRAETMNDPRAKAVLNSAAFDLGIEIREGHIPPIPDAQDDLAAAKDAEIAALTEQRDAALEKADIIGNVCGEAYQVMGALSYLTGTTSHPDVVRALDNLAYHDDPPHGDLLPWPKTLEGLEIEKEIAALTEQRDRAIKTLRKIERVLVEDTNAEEHPC